MHILKLWVVGVALACGPAVGQERAPGARSIPGSQPAGAPADAAARQERLAKAAELPKKTREVRAKGVPDEDVKEALRAAKAKRVGAGEMADVTDEQSRAIDEHGRIDNFGGFVRSKLDEGLRGRELAAAIRAEHARRGIGKGNAKGGGAAGKPEKSGKPEKAGKPEEKGGKPAGQAHPEGKPDRGKPGGGQGGGQGNGKGKGKP